jgi:tRNA pseudouridine55 synthase
VDGLVVVDKPGGLTSHDVVARVRRLAGTRRVGHGGTLDPLATGVLVVGVERATRLLTYVIGSDKRYLATIRLGQATVTDDSEGEITATADAGGLTGDDVRAVLAGFVGEIDQVPSAVSAIKLGGVRSYTRVRRGEQVELAARRVRITQLDVADVRPDSRGLLDVDVDVACSSGTYVRAIARDLGVALGVGGHLTALRRTAVGQITLADAVPLAELATRPHPVTLDLAAAADRFLPRRDVDADAAGDLSYGRPVPGQGRPGPYAVFDPDGRVVAIVSERDGRARPEVVLAPAGPKGNEE